MLAALRAPRDREQSAAPQRGLTRLRSRHRGQIEARPRGRCFMPWACRSAAAKREAVETASISRRDAADTRKPLSNGCIPFSGRTCYSRSDARCPPFAGRRQPRWSRSLLSLEGAFATRERRACLTPVSSGQTHRSAPQKRDAPSPMRVLHLTGIQPKIEN